jgi:hypothetical protein
MLLASRPKPFKICFVAVRSLHGIVLLVVVYMSVRSLRKVCVIVNVGR